MDETTAAPIERISSLAIRLWCRHAIRRDVELRMEGIQHLPREGPVVILCRHYHHYYDGCILLAALPRTVHLLVALDWVYRSGLRAVMEAACKAARWPVVLRSERLVANGSRWDLRPRPTGVATRWQDRGRRRRNPGFQSGERVMSGPARNPFRFRRTGKYVLGTARTSAYSAADLRPVLRRALEDTCALLRAGHVLVIFPEAYPTIDPVYTPKTDDDAFLPFRHGFVHLVQRAQRDGRTRVAIVPAGLCYEHGARLRVRLRLGQASYLEAGADRAALVRTMEEQVRALSDS